MVSAQSVWRAAFAVAAIAVSGGLAQSPSTTPASSTPSVAPTTTVVSVSTTLSSTAFSRSGASASVPFSVAAIPTVLNVTSIITPTPTSSVSPSSSASASPTPTPITLATKLDPAFGVLGAILILIGIPCAFLGHKNRWTSFFLVGFYTLSLVCIVIIIRFGVLDAVNPPSPTVRGMFVLASFVAGVAGGGIAIFFWKAARFFIGAWGGFALGLFVQCFRNGGLIKPIGLRWILYIGCAVVGFVACTLPKIHYHVLLVSTAFIGASSIMLGVDCYTTAGLKEFYIWNLGFNSLFPKFTSAGIQFPVSQTMQIELGLIGAIAFMGAAVQLRILKVLQRKLHEIQEEQRRRDAVDDAKAAERFLDLEQEKREWDAQHPSYGKHMRQDSDFSGMPLMAKDKEAPSPDPESSLRARRQSGLSEFMTATPTFDDDIARRAPVQQQQQPQRFGALPALDLGADIQDDVPQAYISAQALDPAARASKLSEGSTSDGSRKRRETLLTDIGDIRRSIDLLQVMNSGSGSGSERDRDRKTSFASRRTLSYDLATAVLPEAAHARPPRARVHSMELGQLSTIGASEADPIASRPTSAPLRDEDWDAYVRERKLVQPPQGVTAPIPTTELPLPAAVSARPAMSPAVQDAVARRQKRESQMGVETAPPVAPVPRAHAHARPGSYIPPTILPPAKRAGSTSPVQADRPQAPRTVTYEELTERHRAKMREMQSPLTMEERERDEVERAKARWERSRVAEKADVERRQAKEREEKVDVGAGKPRHSRSASADRLAGVVGGAGSKRASVLKVEDWQRYQRQEARGVAFPGATIATSPGGHGERRGSKRMSSGLPSPRDPPT